MLQKFDCLWVYIWWVDVGKLSLRGYLNHSKKLWGWTNLIYDLVNYVIGFSFNLVDKPLLDLGLKEKMYNFPILKIEQIYGPCRLFCSDVGLNCPKHLGIIIQISATYHCNQVSDRLCRNQVT